MKKKLYQYTHKYFQNNIKTVTKYPLPPQKNALRRGSNTFFSYR